MAILIPSMMLAIKDAESGKEALQISKTIANYFNSTVNCLTFGDNSQDLASKFGPAKATIEKGTIGSASKDIHKVLNENNPDLLVLPVNQGTTNHGVVTTTEANKLIDTFERMVLTIPGTASSYDFTHIIVPIDTSFETRQKVPYAVAMAKAFNATLHIIGVSNDKGKDAEVVIKNYTRQVTNNIEEKGITCTLEIRLGGNPTAQIIDYAKEKKAGVIMIMTEQETNLTSFFSGKYSEQMIKNSPIPVLSIHPKDLIISDARL